MTLDVSATSRFKREAAERAVELIQPGMVVGLGTGSTAAFAVRRLAVLRAEGHLLDVVGVPTSIETERLARELGVPLTTLEARPEVDLTLDGADEVAPDFSLIKGAGGAMLREKVVAQASRREVIVVDAAKLSPCLGTRARVPVEVVPMALRVEARFLESLGAQAVPRVGADGALFLTDQGNPVLDCAFGPIAQPVELAARLDARAGILAHGLFLGLATDVVVAGPDGVVLRSR
ncbi:ribose-5-phosphate isomerase RpiA [Corallococcus sp. M34]|uniref:ribose-5-phosphate isomerase RpiA n=1 Tax=Citreicoccus inhibens TaxID=2849499 RepID=UPI001C22FDF7|nr:ribose-5-phosphate isomerase RpiA [Citreicoccus inhibens]MBU8895267.1 ribose-5-phosphate isomerase RpiA [Citreicoccus inhibens]